ncbi:hypothetical protein ACFL6C_06155 [Myxococcota bacterium]
MSAIHRSVLPVVCVCLAWTGCSTSTENKEILVFERDRLTSEQQCEDYEQRCETRARRRCSSQDAETGIEVALCETAEQNICMATLGCAGEEEAERVAAEEELRRQKQLEENVQDVIRKRSCPFLFLWDGERYVYHTDLAGSVLGSGISRFQPQYYDGAIYELGEWRAQGEVFRMKLRETIFEVDYVDQLELVVLDVPEGYQVLNEWSFTSQLGFTSPERFHAIRQPRPPVRARDGHGRDVLFEVSHKDEIPLPVRRDEISRVVVDFGEIQYPENARLVVTAWSVYDDLEAEQKRPYSAGTVIETLDERGQWVVRGTAGKNAGDRHTWVIDVSNFLTPSDTMLRLTMAHQPIGLDVLDQVLLADSEPVTFSTTRVRPRVADLHFAGSTRYEYTTLSDRIRSDDSHHPVVIGAVMSGRFTRYGDVRPLVRAKDDRFVLMAHGDELTLEFDAPAQPDGTDRFVFLDADVFYSIKYDIKERLLSDSVEPLPFHGMEQYPYDVRQWPYRGDRAYRRYLENWNTRQVSPAESQADVPPTSLRQLPHRRSRVARDG